METQKIIKIDSEIYNEVKNILNEGDNNKDGLVIECDYTFASIRQELDYIKEHTHNITTYSDNVYLRDKLEAIESNLRRKLDKLEQQHNQIIGILNIFI
jgi:hypothetical protein